MTSNFKIIDFKNLGKRDINGFLNEKADEVWYDGMHGNPDRSVHMVAKVYFPENFKETLINEGLKVLAREREEYKNLKPSELYNDYKYGTLAFFDNGVQFEQPVKINHDVFRSISLCFNPLVKTGTRSLTVYKDKEFIKLVNERKFTFESHYGSNYFGFDSEKNRYYVSIRVNIDTKINDPESRFLNRSKSKAAWRNRVKEAYNNLVNNGFDIPVWKDNKLVFEQKMD